MAVAGRKRNSDEKSHSLKRPRSSCRPTLPALTFPKSIRPVTSETKQIILDRLRKEIVMKCAWSSTKKRNIDLLDDRESFISSFKRKVTRTRFVTGVNQCTRVLESASQKDQNIQLLILCKDSLNILCHIPTLAKKLEVPLLILSGKTASLDLGKALDLKRVSLCLFLKNETFKEDEKLNDIQGSKQELTIVREQCHAKVDSFLEYILTLM